MAHRMKGHHTGTESLWTIKDKETGRMRRATLQDYNYHLKNMDMVGGWIHKNKKGHSAGGVMMFNSKTGKTLYIKFNRNGRVMEITSDEADENEDEDDLPGKDTNKFGKRTLKNAYNKIKKSLEQFKNSPKKFKEALKNSITMKDTKFNGITEMWKKASPMDLWEKAVSTWENMKGKRMTDLGQGKLFGFIKKVSKTIENKKGYKGLFVKLEEDNDVLNADELLSLLLV